MTAGQKAAAAIERLKANVQANYQDHYAPVSLYNEDQKQQFPAIHEALQPFLNRQFDAVRPPVIELDQVEEKKLKEPVKEQVKVADKK